jgi:hypothetical protein
MNATKPLTAPYIAGMLLGRDVNVSTNRIASILVSIQAVLIEECGEYEADLEGATLAAGRIVSRAKRMGRFCEESDLIEAAQADNTPHQMREFKAAMAALDATEIVVWDMGADRYVVDAAIWGAAQ